MGRVGHSLPRSRYQGRYATLLPRVSAGDPLRDDPNNGYHYHLAHKAPVMQARLLQTFYRGLKPTCTCRLGGTAPT